MTTPSKPPLSGEPPTRFFARFTKSAEAQAAEARALGLRLLSVQPIPFTIELKTPHSLESDRANLARLEDGATIVDSLELAAAVGQTHEIARRERVPVELVERLDVKEITGPWDLTRTWDWREQLRATEEP